jgi:hypothetical protein
LKYRRKYSPTYLHIDGYNFGAKNIEKGRTKANMKKGKKKEDKEKMEGER